MPYKYPDLASFPALENDLILRAARGEPIPRTPVWVMRQAGRYLPEFQQVRKHHDFFQLCQTPDLAAEVTLQPIRRYSGLLDAAIIFSDILVVPQALGMQVLMVPEKGPQFPDPLVNPEDAKPILEKHVDVESELGYVYDAITLTRNQLKGQVPLIGFTGAPWTLFAYMIEGGGSKSFSKAKRWLYSYPELSHQLFDKISDVIIDHLVAQIRAGAQLVQVFDSWAGQLSPYAFRTFALPSLKKIAQTVKSRLQELSIDPVPMILFAMGANQSLPDLKDIGYNVLGIDWTIEPAAARKAVGDNVGIQGNLDPSLLVCPPQAIEEYVQRMFDPARNGFSPASYHIANLGHGITPEVPPEHLKVFLESVHKYGTKV